MKLTRLSASDLNQDIVNQLYGLLDQLSPGKKPFDLAEVIAAGTTVLCAMESDRVLGTASMSQYRVMSGYKAWIEDVVVHQDARGQGLGRQLIEELVRIAREQGNSQVLLFTEDFREAAIALYEKLGFEQKESRIYRLRLDE